jgi:RNA polymerase sigma-70 factor (TIGR02943 family)
MQPDIQSGTNRFLHPEKWIDNYADILYGFTLSRIADKHHAEDIVQSTFLSAWKARTTYNQEASEKNWLFAICRNKIIDYYRKSTNVSMITIEGDQYFDSSGHWTAEARPKSWGQSYDHPGEQTEFYKVLAICSSKLKAIQQKVFSLKYMDDMSSEEICQLLGISSSNYWVLIHRAKLQLRACLEKNWVQLK